MSLITLKGGLVVDEAAIIVAIALEDQGYTLHAADGKLRLTPGAGAVALTDTQTSEILRLKPHLLAIADYRTE